ncbi:Lysine--tRNA ligase [Escovopsis weberi]|uniref:Lysyl-tRNA synthetase n=1 Tax=Escovopsis weberi TaxID=150374 RepID=A0A0M8MYU0_ESCWE|nr:Lysine--tRNA ligase [Escovopsis weberi]
MACWARCLSAKAGSGARVSRFTETREELEEAVSPFKQHRQTELRRDQESEDPLYPKAYPRLEFLTERKSVPEFLEDFHSRLSEDHVTLTGRVRSKRVIGKSLIFVDIVNEFQKLQVMINRNKCVSEKFRTVTGVPVRTNTGQLSLEARQLPELLSPTMEQLPEKLTDPKTRMHERHVDMLVNKGTVDVLRLRAAITKHMRDHFHSKRFLEVQTPILAENAGGAIARPFTTRATEMRDRDLALRIAPELWLKRLVVGGMDKVFEIGPAFRNEGVDATHNPEFTMCEFYSAYTNLRDLIQHTEELLYSLAAHSQQLIATQLTSLPPIDLSRFSRPFRQVEFVPALEQAIGVRLPKLSDPDALPELLVALRLAGVSLPGEVPSSLPKLLDRLAAVYLEPLSFGEPLFITNHPACMSPLAKSFLCPRTYQLVSARAELFIGGRELANMYEEENDPKEQKRKLAFHRSLVNKPDGSVDFDQPPDPSPSAFEAQAEGQNEDENEEDEENEDEDEDEEGEWEASPLDQSYVKALDYALPPTGGWGCGVERLVMLFSGANRISDCLSFGTLRNVVGLSVDETPHTEKEKQSA